MRIDGTRVFLAAAATAWIWAAGAAQADDSVVWNWDETTTGQDIFWTSPTSIDPSAPLYITGFELTLVEVDVTWMGFPFNDIDVTDSLPPELLSGEGAVAGPAPIELASGTITIPEPPDPTCLGATLLIALDAAGFGQLAATDIVLGDCEVDLGFGLVTVQLESLRMAGTTSYLALSCPWDLDASGTVGVTDFLVLLAEWGTSPVGPPDFDADGIVGVADFLDLLAHWGPCPP
jgi:hypothetical protein